MKIREYSRNQKKKPFRHAAVLKFKHFQIYTEFDTVSMHDNAIFPRTKSTLPLAHVIQLPKRLYSISADEFLNDYWLHCAFLQVLT